MFGFKCLLGESDEVFVVRVYVSQLDVGVKCQLLFAHLFSFSQLSIDYAFGFLAQTWISRHLKCKETKMSNNEKALIRNIHEKSVSFE